MCTESFGSGQGLETDCVNSGFRRDVIEIFALLKCYAA
jgi:hypothetical protein